jgi:hypothetical protein
MWKCGAGALARESGLLSPLSVAELINSAHEELSLIHALDPQKSNREET